MHSGFPNRRTAMAAVGAMLLVPLARGAAAAAGRPKITVHKDPNCGCCSLWAEHLRAAGFTVETVDNAAINRLKSKLGVPRELASCHTAEAGGYVIEGHVPASAIDKLLAMRPDAKGLAVPDMPAGSPGMEVEGTQAVEYTVFLFGAFGQRPFARFAGTRELPV